MNVFERESFLTVKVAELMGIGAWRSKMLKWANVDLL